VSILEEIRLIIFVENIPLFSGSADEFLGKEWLHSALIAFDQLTIFLFVVLVLAKEAIELVNHSRN
jgi:uncharacterized membrane protein AbrB (regulator of aidB expression)